MELVAKKHDFTVFNIIFWLIVLMFAFMCLHGSKVYALTFERNNEPVTLSDFTESNEFYIGYDDGLYFIWALNDENSFFYRGTNIHVSGSADVFLYNSELNTWNFSETKTNANIGNENHLVASTVPIYSDINKSGIFFQLSPILLFETIVAEKTQGVEMDKVLQETTGILPVVLIVLVGAIAIRKAIRFLIHLMKLL